MVSQPPPRDGGLPTPEIPEGKVVPLVRASQPPATLPAPPRDPAPPERASRKRRRPSPAPLVTPAPPSSAPDDPIEQARLLREPAWPRIERLIRQAEDLQHASHWATSYRSHAELMIQINRMWGVMSEAEQHEAQRRVERVVPYIASREPGADRGDAFLRLLNLRSLSANPEEDLSRAVKCVAYQEHPPFPYENGEELYPQPGEWGLAGDYMGHVRVGEAPLGYHWWSFVGMLGAACHHKFWVDRGQWDLRLNHYVLLVGEAGTGKSHAINQSRDVAERLNYLLLPERPHERHYARLLFLPEDTNQETLVQILAPGDHIEQHGDGSVTRHTLDSTGWLVLDELATFLGRDTYNVGKRLPWLVTCYGKRNYQYHTKSGGQIWLRNLALSMLAATAPHWLRDSVDTAVMHGGFLDRTVVVYRKRTRRLFGTPPPLDPTTAIDLASRLVDLARQAHSYEMAWTHAAAKWHEEWYLTDPRHQYEFYESREGDEFGTTRQRRSNHLFKLAAVLSLCSGDSPWIDVRHFEKALEIYNLEDDTFTAFRDNVFHSQGSERIAWVLRTLDRYGGTMTVSKLGRLSARTRHFGGRSDVLDRTLETCRRYGFVEMERSQRDDGVQVRGHTVTLTPSGQDHLQHPKDPVR